MAGAASSSCLPPSLIAWATRLTTTPVAAIAAAPSAAPAIVLAAFAASLNLLLAMAYLQRQTSIHRRESGGVPFELRRQCGTGRQVPFGMTFRRQMLQALP